MKRPQWRYYDNSGIEHFGFVKKIYDNGKTYLFKDETTGMVVCCSGGTLKKADITGKICEVPDNW